MCRFQAMGRIRNIALLEDHPLTRAGVKLALTPLFHFSIEASSSKEFFTKFECLKQIELVLLDITLPDESGIEVARRLKSEYPNVRILVFSVDTSEDTVRQLLEIGVDGLLSKRSSESTILHAVSTVIDGGHFYLEDEEKLERDILISQVSKPKTLLTEREQEILIGFCKGMTSFELADTLCLSQRTVENHKLHIFRKCGINNTVEMLLYALNNGIVTM